MPTPSTRPSDVVVAGHDVAGISAELALNYPITGLVTVDGVNMPAVTVTAWRPVPGPTPWEAVKYTSTGPDGTYALYLPDGTYRVEFSTWQGRFATQYYPGVSTLDLAADVVVAGAEVPGIGATIVSGDTESGPAITGTVTVDGTGAAAEGVFVAAYRWNVLLSAWVIAKSSATLADGTYTLFVPEGTYRVEFSHFLRRYERAFYGGGDSANTAADVVVPTAGVPDIDAVVRENHSISGVITADPVPGLPPGAPPTQVTAWRWNPGSSDWDRVSDGFNTPQGDYVLYVPDGTYRVGFTVFFELFQPLFYPGVDNLGEASDVTVAGGDVPNINAHVVADSTDPPPTWPSAATLSAAGEDAWSPDVAVGPKGTATAVWYLRDNGRVQATTRAANGVWSSPLNLSSPGDDASDPQVALGPKGAGVSVWRRWDGTHYQVQAATRSANGHWNAPVTLSRSVGDAADAQVSMSAQGTAVAAWRVSEGTSSRVQAATLGANGRWSAPVNLSKAGGDAWDPQVALGSDGSAVAAWSRFDGTHYRVQVSSRTAQGSWSSPTSLSPAGEDAWDPQLAMGAGGRAAAVWRRWDGANDRIQAVLRSPGGAWSIPESVSTSGRNAHDPKVSLSPDGIVTAVWARWDGSNDRVQAASWTPGGTWSTPTTLSLGGQSAEDPEVAAGPEGRATAVWRQSDGYDEWVLSAIRMQAGSWSTRKKLTQGSWRTARPTVASGPDGAVAAVWERREGTDDRVQGVVRIDPLGSHCNNGFGVDLNVLFGVPEQFVHGACTTITAGSTWRPLRIWYMNTAFDAVPPGFVPAGETPLEDFLVKVTSVKVVIDGGTKRQRTVVFSPSEALRVDRTFDEYDLTDFAPYPMAAMLPRVGLSRSR